MAQNRATGPGGVFKWPGRLFYGWWIAIAGLLQNYYSSGTFYYGFGAFFNPIADEFGWKYATTSVAFSIQQSETGAFAPFVGFFIDRFGPRRVMLAGAFLTGLGFILLSRINSLMTFYGGVIVLAIGMSLSSYLVITTTVSNWFVRMRGRAMAILTTGAGLAGTMLPLLVFLIDRYGWRESLVFIGIGTWVVSIPVAFLLRRRPEDYGQLPDGGIAMEEMASQPPAFPQKRLFRLRRIFDPDTEFTIGQAIKTPAFWLLAISLTCSAYAGSGISVHLIPAQVSLGFSRETAALTVTLLTLLSLAGRWVGGWLADYIDQRYILATGYTFQAAGIVVLSVASSYWHIVLFLLLYCPGFGATIPTRLVIQARYFGRRSFGTVMGILTTVSTAFSIAAPIIAGWMYDMQQSYHMALLVLAIVCFVGAPITMLMRRPRLPSGN